MSLAFSSISLSALILFSFTIIIFNSKGQCTHVSSLKFSPNSSFKVALFADLHYGEATSTDWGPQQDKNSSKAMSTLLDRERPGLAISLVFLISCSSSSSFMSLLYFFFFSLSIHLIGLAYAKEDSFLLVALSSLSPSSSSTFKIALFADLHYGENAWSDWGPDHDINSDRVMSLVLDREKPDFVVFLGDIITANNLLIANASYYWEQAISPTRKRGIPWATVFGNHDDASFVWPSEWFSATGIPHVRCPAKTLPRSGEGTCSFRGTTRLELMKDEIERNNLSCSESGPMDLWPSVSNYVLQMKSSENPKSTVAFLYFLDSGGGSYPEVISNAQARWFQQKSQEINPGSRVPELVFWHIPSKAYGEVAPAPGSVINEPCVGSINMEGVAVQDAEWGIMDVLSSRPSVKAVFVGHNHGNDWCCPYKKLWLCYARHTGYGGYGTWPKGARIIDITEQPFSIKSWIRMEKGDIHSEVVLSS